MSNSFFEAFARKLVAAGLVDEDDPLVGLDAAEIAQLEEHFQVKLPAAYKNYLSVMGRSSGEFNSGSNFWYPEVLGFKKDACELLPRRLPAFNLSDHDFVFGTHQGYQFWYFDTRAGEDPPVFYYLEGDMPPVKKFDHFSELMEAMLQGHVRILEQLASNR